MGSFASLRMTLICVILRSVSDEESHGWGGESPPPTTFNGPVRARPLQGDGLSRVWERGKRL